MAGLRKRPTASDEVGSVRKRPAGNFLDTSYHEPPKLGVTDSDRLRLRRLFKRGLLLHPTGGKKGGTNFVDLAKGLALCCGVAVEQGSRQAQAEALAREIGGMSRQHIIVVLCDGMGNTVMEKHLEPSSFLRRHNDPGRLRAVFPATTPAALTTLATAAWPGQHGQPGWDLRDQKGCEYPGKATQGPVQLRILHPDFADMRTSRRAAEFGFTNEDLFVARPWAPQVSTNARRLIFTNAYQGTDFTNWYQGKSSPSKDDPYKIAETAAETLGTPEGSEKAVAYFSEAVDNVLRGVREAEREGRQSYSYLYTAHPDKHMHPLGVEHPEVRRVLRGLDEEVARLWSGLSSINAEGARSLDCAMVVTADHSHVTVAPQDMVTLPPDLVECLEYANIGVHGKGRHAYFHLRSGRRPDFEARWAEHPRLHEAFLLLTVEDASAEGLFGPEPVRSEVRPRLGDLVAISLGAATLVTPDEAQRYRDGPAPRCQGAHGSLCREDLSIPFILCTTPEQGGQKETGTEAA